MVIFWDLGFPLLCIIGFILFLFFKSVNLIYYWYCSLLKLQDKEEDKEVDIGSDEPEAPLPLTVTSRVSYLYTFFILYSDADRLVDRLYLLIVLKFRV